MYQTKKIAHKFIIKKISDRRYYRLWDFIVAAKREITVSAVMRMTDEQEPGYVLSSNKPFGAEVILSGHNHSDVRHLVQRVDDFVAGMNLKYSEGEIDADES